MILALLDRPRPPSTRPTRWSSGSTRIALDQMVPRLAAVVDGNPKTKVTPVPPVP